MGSSEGTEASQLLLATETVRLRTRRVRRSFWLPLALFGLVVIASGWTCGRGGESIGSTANSAYWLLAGGAAYAAVYWFYRRRPVWTEIRPYIGIGAFVLWMSLSFYVPVLGGALSRALFRDPLQAGALQRANLELHLLSVVVAALLGLAAVAWLHRRRRTAAIAGIVAIGLLVGLGGPSILLYGLWGATGTAVAAAIVAADSARLARRGVAWTAGLIGAAAVMIGVFPTLFGTYYVSFPAAVLFGNRIIPTAAPVAAIAVGLLVLAVQVRSPWLAITAVTVGVLAVLSGLFIIDNFFDALPSCSADMAGIGAFMLACAGVAALAEHRRLASP